VFGRTKEEPPPQARLAGSASQGEAAVGPSEGPLVLLFALLTLAAIAFVLARAERAAEHDPVARGARGETRSLDRQSLVREPNLRRVLGTVAASAHPLVTDIRVSATRVDLTVRDRDGIRKSVSVDAAFKTKESDFGAGEDDAIPASRLDAAGPERMARAVIARTGLGAGAVDYVTLQPLGIGQPTWYLFMKQGPARDRQWAAAMDGSDLRHPGDLSRSQKAANARTKRHAEAEQRRIRRAIARQNACLRKATDAQAAARCIQRFQP
jgi:hypothetical protein